MSNKSTNYKLVFATNFKAENPYLQEWIEYHLLVGVDHFYLYDQDGGEDARKILAPYERAGLVSRHSWTHYDGTRFDGPTRFYQINKNHLAFAHCARNYRHTAEWMMKIDVDEFLYPPAGDDSLLPWLHSISGRKIRGISIPRFNFGYNFHEQRPSGLVIESYTRREENASDHKDMANCAFLSNNRFCHSAHSWHYRWYPGGRFLRENASDGIRINHYYTKSFEEYRLRQNVSRGRGRSRSTFESRNTGCHAIEDAGMLRFAGTVKNNISKHVNISLHGNNI